MISTIELTKKLISLPSYVNNNQDETAAVDFLMNFLAKSFPDMSAERQYLGRSRRCNIILRGKSEPKLFVLGHIDTVQPKVGWQANPLKPMVQNGKLYGLGAADMKGSLAAFLCALSQTQQDIDTGSLMLLIYIDEEYDFKGIRKFVESRSSKINPELTLSLDGELAVATGCRGLIEVSITSKGKSGHAANPSNGINAISGTVAALANVSKDLSNLTDADLGQTTTNIAAIRGGVLQNTGNKTVWLNDGNVIPDTAEVVFEVRPAKVGTTADLVLQKIETELGRHNLTLSNSSVRHDIAPWPVQYDRSAMTLLRKSYAGAGVPFGMSDRKLQGYIDAQMVAEKVRVPTFIIGTGGNNKHGADENVSLYDLKATTKIYTSLLREVLGRSASVS